MQPFSSEDDEAMRESATAVRVRDKYQFQQVECWTLNFDDSVVNERP